MTKKCRQCGAGFEARNSLHVACSPRCAIDLAQAKAIKKRRGETLAMKRDLNDNDRQYQLKQAQACWQQIKRRLLPKSSLPFYFSEGVAICETALYSITSTNANTHRERDYEY